MSTEFLQWYYWDPGWKRDLSARIAPGTIFVPKCVFVEDVDAVGLFEQGCVGDFKFRRAQLIAEVRLHVLIALEK